MIALTLKRVVLLAAIALCSPMMAQAQSTTVCGPDIKNEVAKALEGASKLSLTEQSQLQASLYQKYKYCGTYDAAALPAADPFHTAARQCGAKVAYLGSVYYEEMSCCGYDPQRRTFACPVKIKQNFGFGAAPNPGSREYVYHCVADAAGVFQPVGDDSVHLANSVLAPTWQFAVVANAINNLQLVQPMNGVARRARSILSWNLRPTSCNYQPIWGNVLEYSVRLDQ
ncbi:MAG: hypothetical protein Q7V20_05345 [Aquabacterium sp.]|uniref:hypothetical protein n=1 Tax=Aquabacterium sp. TaxID=1872578 RepID=UPI002726D8DF|nr:hypothetical protein [Aquabacterium sp.]MDO9002860.1 hypothetical protein [Aquabacterium sp.]